MMRLLAQPTATGGRAVGRLEADRREVVSAGRLIVPAAGEGLRDPDAEVRRRSAEAIQQVAAALLNQLPSPREAEEALDLETDRREAADLARRSLPPLIRALRDQTPALGRALADPDLEVRLLARRTLEDLGNARQRLLRLPPAAEAGSREEPGGPGPGGNGASNGDGAEQPAAPPGSAATEQLLLEGLRTALPALIRGLADPDAEARLGAIDALEVLGPSAAPAVPALLRALCDRNRFVRWATARTLGKIGPVEEQPDTVPALARMLQDQDLSLRLAAATALEQYGPAARAALPDLIRAMRASDGTMRIGAIRAIEAIGTDAAGAIPSLTAALDDADPRVRQSAAEVLGRHLDDTSPEVRRAASDALLDITQE
jgi:HEAT repeat protein